MENSVTPLETIYRRLGSKLAEAFFRGSASLGRLHPLADPARHGLEVLRDLPYRATGIPEHRLDIYRSSRHEAPLPVVLYLHGGGFRIMSKETHWVMGLAFGRRGYLTVLPEYRLAPRQPFPAAVEDAAAAYVWVREHIARFGGDPARIALAGESAGANLVTALVLAACFEREEPFAREVFKAGPAPLVAAPACGLFQVTDPERFRRRRPGMARFLSDRILETSRSYLPNAEALPPGLIDFADTVVALERGEAPARPLPPFFLGVGTKDPLLPDTRRLATALTKIGVPHEVHYYPGEMHAFQAFVFRENAKRFWRAQYDFLARHL
ncbi:MAG: alpha/beta hydrolase [Polyangia bacterium]|nr:alpha/beta hydrolase [Polyangia bacterium]